MDYLKETGDIILGICTLILIGLWFIFVAAFMCIPMFTGMLLIDSFDFNKWMVMIPAFIIEIPWFAFTIVITNKINDKFGL